MAVDKGKRTFAKAGWKSQKSSVFKTFHSLKSFLSCTLSFFVLHLGACIYKKKKKMGFVFVFFLLFLPARLNRFLTQISQVCLEPDEDHLGQVILVHTYVWLLSSYLPRWSAQRKKTHQGSFQMDFKLTFFVSESTVKAELKYNGSGRWSPDIWAAADVLMYACIPAGKAWLALSLWTRILLCSE